jgi:hypothetical protein
MKTKLLLFFIFCGVAGFGQTAIYTVATTSTVSATGTLPVGSNGNYTQTFGTLRQITSGNSATLT